MEKMTVKELANVAGVSVYTIRRTAGELYPHPKVKGKKAFYNKQQSLCILENVKKKNMVSVIPEVQNALVKKEVQENKKEVQNALVNYEAIGKMIGMAVTAALSPIVDRLDKLSTQKALPEPVKQDSYSLVAYCKINQITVNQSELAVHGMALRKIANREGIKLNKIPDERWGFVNSYPVKILDEYFAA